MSRFRWTRKRWYRAQHLSRLLAHMSVNAPPLVARYHDLLGEHYDRISRRDPLLEPIKYRLSRFADDIPF